MNTPTKRWMTLVLLLATSLAATACNTTRGFGEDVEKAGEEIQEETNK